MKIQQIEMQLEKIKNTDLSSFGYEFKSMTENMLSSAKMWVCHFENSELKTELLIRLSVEGGEREVVAMSSFLKTSRPKCFLMDLDRFAREHKKPLAEVRWLVPEEPLEIFVDRYLVQFLKAAGTYFNGFMRDEDWENQPDHRDMI